MTGFIRPTFALLPADPLRIAFMPVDVRKSSGREMAGVRDMKVAASRGGL